MADYTYTHFPWADNYTSIDSEGNISTDIPSNVREVLKEGSYLMYELEDSTVEIPLFIDEGERGTDDGKYYTKHLSPLFNKEVIDNKNNWYLLDIITEEVPFYYMEPEAVYIEDDIILSATRDIGITNVPSPLQDNDFWMTWFRNATGYIKNSMILDIYNKLRYPYIFENQYLNAKILNRLANILVKDIPNPNARLAFKASDEENTEVYDSDYRFYGHEVGCLDYLEDIVQKKIDSIYALIDFSPEYSGFLSDWVESLYKSGKLTYEESQEEALVYKLQEIRGELLRRKFAGTYSLYMLLLNSMGKTGSYLGVITAADSDTQVKAYYDENGSLVGYVKSYNDTRPVRIPNIPGIYTEYNESAEAQNLNPIDIFYNKPDDKDKMSLGTLIPLFYSSTDVRVLGGEILNGSQEYCSEIFYKAIDKDYKFSLGRVNPKSILEYEQLSIESPEYRAAFFRDSSNAILWDNLPGVLNHESVLNNSDTLDTIVEDENKKGSFRYRTLDERMTFIDENGVSKEGYRTLDNNTEKYDLSSVYGSVLDVTADDILYHRNILQKEGKDYEFITYPIADGNGLCLMDTSWLNYMEYYSKQKSKVNEDITFGVQISTYIDVDDILLVPYEYFTIEEDGDYINLYHNLVKYRADNYLIETDAESGHKSSIVTTLMTKIRKKHPGPASFYKEGELLPAYKEFEKFTKFNVGLIPFTYKGLSEEQIESMKLGSNGSTWDDDLDIQNLAEAYFYFSKSDIPYSIPNKDNEDYLFLEYDNILDVKTVYFKIKRIEDGVTRYVWSDPIRVFPVGILDKGDYFKPDWLGLVYYLNPYFNFTTDSASPIRHKPALKAPISKEVDTKDTEDTSDDVEYYVLNNNLPSEDTALCNLARMRRLDYLCADAYEKSIVSENGVDVIKLNFDKIPWYNKNQNCKGLYLEKFYTEGANVALLGDNRYADPYEITYDRIISTDAENNPFMSVTDIPRPYNKDALYKVTPNLGLVTYYKVSAEDQLVLIKDFNPLDKYSEVYKDQNSIPCLKQAKKSGCTTALNLKTIGEGTSWIGTDGFTICIDVVFDTVQNCTFFEQGSISLKYEGGKFTFCGVSITETATTDKNYRIAASVNNGEVYLVVNNSSESGTGTYTLTEGDIKLFRGFLGEIYDFRLYNEGRDLPNLRILSAGMFREVYSYAPANYKLAHSIYVDNSLVKMVDNTSNNVTPYGIKKIGSIRVFNRSVWDSIMLDMFPVSTMEADSNSPQYYEFYKNPKDDTDVYLMDENGNTYLNDCVEQSLLEEFEVLNGKALKSSTTLIHNNKSYFLSKESYITAILALIQPVSCKDEGFESKSFLTLNNDRLVSTLGSSVTIPMKSDMRADASDDYFKYSADLNINFNIPVETNFSWFLARGTNIGLKYHSVIDDTLVIPIDTTVKGSTDNYILLPLYVPKQRIDNIYIDRFYIRDFAVSRTLEAFLRATSYYNEIRIPVPIDIKDPGYVPINGPVGEYIVQTAFELGWEGIYYYQTVTEEGQTVTKLVKVVDINEKFREDVVYYRWDADRRTYCYYNKWDAIRTLKEGSYIFTCKYPFKILPYTDPDFSNNNKDYNTLYGTIRFKVDISGTPKNLTLDEKKKYSISKGVIPEEYMLSNVENTLKSTENRVNPEDNSTFPHRKMTIRLSVYDIKNTQMESNPKSDIAGMMKGDTEDYEFDWRPIGSNVESEVFEDTYRSVRDDEAFDPEETYYRQVSEPEEGYVEVAATEDDYKTYLIRVERVPKNNMVYLNSENLDNGLIITSSCPLFMMNNYIEPFYVKNLDKAHEDVLTEGSEDDDIIDPIVIKKDIFSTEENLMSETSAGLNKLALISGQTYKLLFDFTPRNTEFKYVKSDNSTIDILDNQVVANPSEYSYVNSGEISNNDVSLNNNTLGYKWDGDDWVSHRPGLGNPYSSNSDNLLVAKNSSMGNSYQIRYLDDFEVMVKDSNGEITFVEPLQGNQLIPYRFNNQIPYRAFDYNGALDVTKIIEADLLKYHYDIVNPKSIINDFKAHTYGVIGGLSYVTPNFVGADPVTSILVKTSSDTLPVEGTEQTLSENTYDFCSYQTPSWKVPLDNNAVIRRTSNKSNSVINTPLNSKGPDRSNWLFEFTNFIYKSVNRDLDPTCVSIFIREHTHNGHIKVRYVPKGKAAIDGVYEASIKLNFSDEIDVGLSHEDKTITAVYYRNNAVVYSCPMTPGTKDAEGWVTYRGITFETVLADSIEYDICVNRGTSMEDDEDVEITSSYLRIKDAAAYYYAAKFYRLGLSETYMNKTSYDKIMYVISHTVPTFTRLDKNDNTSVRTFIPILFKPEITSPNSKKRPIPGIYRAASFISSCAVEDADPYSRIRKLKAPWIRRLNFYYQGDESRVEFHKYGVRKNSLGISEYREIYSDIKDIYTLDSQMVPITATLSSDKEKDSYDLHFTGGIKMNLADDGTLNYFNNNLKVYTNSAVSLTNERMSYTYNCFDLNRYSRGLDSYIGVTNIQLMNRDIIDDTGTYDNREVIYEIEYLPIIYNELKNHISFNIMLNHVSKGNSSDADTPIPTPDDSGNG